MTTTKVADLYGHATVGMAVEEAFTFFTESIGRWWPAEYHIGSSAMVDTILEPQPGGRWYERGDDGSECDWGRVLTWEPPHRTSSRGRSTAAGSTTPTLPGPARSKSGSHQTGPSRPWSNSSTDTSAGSSMARPCTTPSNKPAAAGPPSCRSTPQRQPTETRQAQLDAQRSVNWNVGIGQDRDEGLP